MSTFLYRDDVEIKPGSLVLNVPQFISRSELFAWYNNSLNFPYFGNNWDALYDMLKDLSWVTEYCIYLRHRHSSKLPITDLKIYLNIMENVVHHWNSLPEHKIIVTFPKEGQKSLGSVLPYDPNP